MEATPTHKHVEEYTQSLIHVARVQPETSHNQVPACLCCLFVLFDYRVFRVRETEKSPKNHHQFYKRIIYTKKNSIQPIQMYKKDVNRDSHIASSPISQSSFFKGVVRLIRAKKSIFSIIFFKDTIAIYLFV